MLKMIAVNFRYSLYIFHFLIYWKTQTASNANNSTGSDSEKQARKIDSFNDKLILMPWEKVDIYWKANSQSLYLPKDRIEVVALREAIDICCVLTNNLDLENNKRCVTKIKFDRNSTDGLTFYRWSEVNDAKNSC